MSQTRSSAAAGEAADLLSFWRGDGIAKTLLRSADWSQTTLGPAQHWPQSLKTTLGTMLNSPHPMLLLWGANLLRFYNDAFLPSLAPLGQQPPPMGQPAAESGPEAWAQVWPQVDEVMRAGHASRSEGQLVPVMRNGVVEDAYWSYGPSPVFDESGEVGGTLIICTETTARVVAERRQRTLRRLLERMSAATSPIEVVQHASEVIADAAVDMPFVLIYAGQGRGDAMVRVNDVGLTTEQLARMDAAIRHRVGSAPSGAAGQALVVNGLMFEVAGSDGQANDKVFVVSALGSTQRWGDAIAFGLNPRVPFDDGYREFLEQFATSIGLALVRVQAARLRMATQTERDQLLLQAPVAAAVLTGPDHAFQLANKLFCEVLGRSDLVGKKYVEAFPEPTHAPLLRSLDSVYQSGRRQVTGESLMRLDRRGDGRLDDCYFKFNLEPMRNSLGRVYGMMIVAIDITEQVRARQVLEHTDAQRKKLLDELESASQAKDEFLAMLGHELRNPLSPIVTALQLMKLRGETGTSREQAIIQRQVDHLIRLVDDLLDVSKITRGKVELRRETLEIADVLAKAVEIASVLFEQRNHELAIDVSREGLQWQGDSVRLAQVVANLLTNAARYTPPGGQVRLSAGRDHDDIVIRVADNGIGISAELLPRVFDLFVQGGRGVDRAEGGLGIGLALVRNLVHLHGGTVTAHSEGPGRGSEFVIRLPPVALSDAQPHAVAGWAQRHAMPAAAAKRVLVVDDNRDAADLLAEVLRALGHHVCVATDPVASLVLAREFGPQVAVLDIGLPGMDGYELAQRLRETMEATPCKLIALTGYGQELDRKRSAEAGFDAHLVKPADIDLLGRLINSG